MTIHICLFGGPGTGKSTTASGLFHRMKCKQHKVEYITEYAKDLVYSKDFYRIKDQFYIFAKQHHPWFKLKDQVDFTINDGPFIMGCLYNSIPGKPGELLNELIIETYKSYDTINIFLERNNDLHPYQNYGRTQTEDESINLDVSIKNLLDVRGIKYHNVKISEYYLDEILEIVKSYEEL